MMLFEMISFGGRCDTRGRGGKQSELEKPREWVDDEGQE
jgi:hypothetical protein